MGKGGAGKGCWESPPARRRWERGGVERSCLGTGVSSGGAWEGGDGGFVLKPGAGQDREEESGRGAVGWCTAAFGVIASSSALAESAVDVTFSFLERGKEPCPYPYPYPYSFPYPLFPTLSSFFPAPFFLLLSPVLTAAGALASGTVPAPDGACFASGSVW